MDGLPELTIDKSTMEKDDIFDFCTVVFFLCPHTRKAKKCG
jgi:hypothetical protein